MLLCDFARTPGAKDKKKRKKRNVVRNVLGGAVVGGLAFGALNAKQILRRTNLSLRRLKRSYQNPIDFGPNIGRHGYDPEEVKVIHKLADRMLRKARMGDRFYQRIQPAVSKSMKKAYGTGMLTGGGAGALLSYANREKGQK